MASSQEKYFKNYRFEQISDNSRKGYKNVYTYIGDYYTFDVPAHELQKKKLFFCIGEIVTVILFLFSSTCNIPINKTAASVIPAILSICIWIFEIIGVGFFCYMKFPLKEEDYKRIDSTFFISFVGRFLCLLVTAVAGFLETIIWSIGFRGILVSLGYLICSIIALCFKIQYKNLNTKKKILLSENR